jgi:hypothetical protein
MMPSTLRVAFALLACLLLTIAAAQPGGTRATAPGVLLGYVAQIDAALLDAPTDHTGPIEIRASGPGGEDVARLRVTLGADGAARLQGTLPDLRAGALLAPIGDESLWPCPMTASTAARFLPLALRAADDATVEIANRALPAEPTAGYRQLVLVFADADVYVQGACHDAPQALTVDLYLRPGWNLVVSEVVGVRGELRVALRSAADADLADVGWYWRALGSGRTTETIPQRP